MGRAASVLFYVITLAALTSLDLTRATQSNTFVQLGDTATTPYLLLP